MWWLYHGETPTVAFIEQIHSDEIEVFMDIMGDMDNPDGMRSALELGVDALQTDHPDILLQVIDAWKRSGSRGRSLDQECCSSLEF